MKTFISSILIFALLCAFIAVSSIGMSRRLSQISETAMTLPKNEEDFVKDKAESFKKTKKLCSLWQETMELLPYFVAYDILQIANEAALTLQASTESGTQDDFFNARIKFCDAVSRIREFFGVRPKILF